VAFPLDEEFLAALDKARGAKSRSALVREAIYEHLTSLGYVLPKSLTHPPDRAGKGGRPAKVVKAPKANAEEIENPLPPTTGKKVTRPEK
jgi:hypothetical protein